MERSLLQYAVFPHAFPKFPQNFPQLLSKASNSKCYEGLPFYQNNIILKGSLLEKCGEIWKNGCFSGQLYGQIGEIPHERLWPD